MALIKVNLSKKLKKMKPMHGGGQPPIGGNGLIQHFHYMTEAGIPYSRLHDVGGPYGGGRFVDIPNLFRNFDADENDPSNYDFTFTDYLIKAIIEAKVEPYFRLGTTIENESHIKAYHIYPPKDYHKWARICEHVIRHYTEGWADGFHYNIRYWEIWNEPEVQNKMMWMGTSEEYKELYDVTAKHLKACFPHLMIGGYASCGFYAIAPEMKVDADKQLLGTIPPSELEESHMRFFYGFFKYIKEHGSPIDFFSWHSYADVSRVTVMDKWLHERLEEYGYGDIETHLNEWNPFPYEFGTPHHSAEIAAMMLALQHGHADICCIYDMRVSTSPWCPLFDIRYRKPIHGYYSMKAFNRLYELGTQVETVCDNDRLYVVAATDGEHHAIMISNLTKETQNLEIEGVDLTNAKFYVIDETRMLTEAPNTDRINNNEVFLIEW